MAERQASSPEERGVFYYHIVLARALEHTARVAIETEHEATHDELTGALNRKGLRKYLKTAEAPKAMLLVDATNFKSVNDRFGYRVGDLVVGETYRLLAESVRPNDVITRVGGDEFLVILNGENQESHPADVGERRVNRARIEYIDPIKTRIAENVQSLLANYKELEHVNFDLAVGGIEWPGLTDIELLIAEAEKEMKAHKATQHQNDRQTI